VRSARMVTGRGIAIEDVDDLKDLNKVRDNLGKK
jgi:hypothetical protein